MVGAEAEVEVGVGSRASGWVVGAGEQAGSVGVCGGPEGNPGGGNERCGGVGGEAGSVSKRAVSSVVEVGGIAEKGKSDSSKTTCLEMSMR